jgi:hypothetical protein
MNGRMARALRDGRGALPGVSEFNIISWWLGALTEKID